jgi:hypothetical protein
MTYTIWLDDGQCLTEAVETNDSEYGPGYLVGGSYYPSEQVALSTRDMIVEIPYEIANRLNLIVLNAEADLSRVHTSGNEIPLALWGPLQAVVENHRSVIHSTRQALTSAMGVVEETFPDEED